MMGMYQQDFLSKWMEGTGPASDVVISSRIRLARNLEATAFPPRISTEEASQVIGQVSSAVAVLPRQEGFQLTKMQDLSDLEKQVMVEKHLISPLLARQSKPAAVVLSENEAVSIMVNEEDHLRIQCLYPGLQLNKALEHCTLLDDVLEERLSYAYKEPFGFLTSCPTNVGTGMRASVMVHLPGLALSKRAVQVFNAVSKLGVVVRGIYGEGSEGSGNIFQISNQITLGHSEEEIIHNLEGVTQQVIDRERDTRTMLQEELGVHIEDRIFRARGVLENARIANSEETIRLLSDLRLGVDLGIIEDIPPKLINELIVLTRPACLQMCSGGPLPSDQRDLRRAEIMRERLKKTEKA